MLSQTISGYYFQELAAGASLLLPHGSLAVEQGERALHVTHVHTTVGSVLRTSQDLLGVKASYERDIELRGRSGSTSSEAPSGSAGFRSGSLATQHWCPRVGIFTHTLIAIFLTPEIEGAESSTPDFGGYYRRQVWDRPPSTGRVTPVIHWARGEAKKAIASATSSGWPTRPKG